MTRGGASDPDEALFSFKRAAFFCSLIYTMRCSRVARAPLRTLRSDVDKMINLGKGLCEHCEMTWKRSESCAPCSLELGRPLLPAFCRRRCV
nr:hypothetical protein Iba_scaffold13896CG0010 [Ipomoea batatas]